MSGSIYDDLPASLEDPTCPDALIRSLPSSFYLVAFMKPALFWGNIDQIHPRISYFQLLKRTNTNVDVLKAKQ